MQVASPDETDCHFLYIQNVQFFQVFPNISVDSRSNHFERTLVVHLDFEYLTRFTAEPLRDDSQRVLRHLI